MGDLCWIVQLVGWWLRRQAVIRLCRVRSRQGGGAPMGAHPGVVGGGNATPQALMGPWASRRGRRSGTAETDASPSMVVVSS